MGAIKEIRKWLLLAFFNFQLYSFNLNLPFHDSFHPRIGEPNRGGGRDTNLKKGKEKKNFTNSTSCRKIIIIVCIKQIFSVGSKGVR